MPLALEDDDYPMTPRELCEALRLTIGTFYQYQSKGRFERFELVPRIGPRRYCRRLVQQYLARENSRTAFPKAVSR